MTAHDNLNTAPQDGTTGERYINFCNLYRQRQDALNLAKQLIQMIKGAQRHRGMSMALLGGNSVFREEFERLQHQLEHRLMSLRAFAACSENLLSARDQENLKGAWVSISHDWQQDSVIDNYELHCHLIEQLLGMLGTLSKQLELPVSILAKGDPDVSPASLDSNVYPNRFKHLEVLHFSTRLMPAVVEQIGRIRALSTYAAAIGYCDSHHDSKLRYVIQSTKVNNEKLRHQAKRLEGILEKDVGLLSQLKSYEIKLMFLLDMVGTDILGHSTHISADSSRLFNVATDIIDVYLKVIEDGILLITRWNEEDVEAWLQSDS